MRRRTRPTRGLAFALFGTVAVLALSACGDSDSSGSASSANAGSAKSGSAKAEPLKVMVISAADNAVFNFPGVWDVAKAYASDINAKGGINGHQLEIVTCNEMADPNAAERCGREAVSDKVVALVGGVTISADRVFPTLEQAGIPWLGNSPLLTADFTSKMSYPIPPYPDEFAAAANKVAKCSNPAWTHLDTASGQSLFNSFATPGYQAVHPGAKPEPVAVVSPKITDFEPVASKLAKADCIYLQLPEPLATQLLPALQRAGSKAKIYTVAANFTPKYVQSSPQMMEGASIVASTELPSESPDWQEARDAVAKYASGANVTLDGTNESNAWVSLKVFTELASKISGPITSKALIDALNASGAIDSGNLVPPIDFSKQGTVPSLPRLVNHQVIDWTIKDGKLATVPNAAFYDVSGLLK